MQKGMKLMSDPRVMKMMQDERVMKAVMAAMAVPGKAQSIAKEQLENVAKAMALAAGRARAGHHRSIDDYLKSTTGNGREGSK